MLRYVSCHKAAVVVQDSSVVEEDTGAILLISLTTDPLVFWRAFGQERCTDENGVLTSGRVVDEHASFSDSSSISTVLFLGQDFLKLHVHSRGETWEHGGSASQHDVLNERNETINITLGEALVDLFMVSNIFNSGKFRSEHALSSEEALTADLDDSAVWKLILLVQQSRLVGKLSILNGVIRDEALCLLDLSDSLEIGRGVESITTEGHELDQVLGDMSTGKVKSLDCVSDDKAIDNWDHVRDTITRIEDETSAQTLSHQR